MMSDILERLEKLHLVDGDYQSVYSAAAAEITHLRADRNAVIRECAVAIKHVVHSAIYTVGTREGAAPCDYSEAANEAIEQSILALIEGDE